MELLFINQLRGVKTLKYWIIYHVSLITCGKMIQGSEKLYPFQTIDGNGRYCKVRSFCLLVVEGLCATS